MRMTNVETRRDGPRRSVRVAAHVEHDCARLFERREHRVDFGVLESVEIDVAPPRLRRCGRQGPSSRRGTSPSSGARSPHVSTPSRRAEREPSSTSRHLRRGRVVMCGTRAMRPSTQRRTSRGLAIRVASGSPSTASITSPTATTRRDERCIAAKRGDCRLPFDHSHLERRARGRRRSISAPYCPIPKRVHRGFSPRARRRRAHTRARLWPPRIGGETRPALRPTSLHQRR